MTLHRRSAGAATKGILTAAIEPWMESALAAMAQRRRVPRAVLVREALARYLENEADTLTAADLDEVPAYYGDEE